MRITNELLDLLGDEYMKLEKEMKIDRDETPFYLFLERESHIFNKLVSNNCRTHVTLCR